VGPPYKSRGQAFDERRSRIHRLIRGDIETIRPRKPAQPPLPRIARLCRLADYRRYPTCCKLGRHPWTRRGGAPEKFSPPAVFFSGAVTFTPFGSITSPPCVTTRKTATPTQRQTAQKRHLSHRLDKTCPRRNPAQLLSINERPSLLPPPACATWRGCRCHPVLRASGNGIGLVPQIKMPH